MANDRLENAVIITVKGEVSSGQLRSKPDSYDKVPGEGKCYIKVKVKKGTPQAKELEKALEEVTEAAINLPGRKGKNKDSLGFSPISDGDDSDYDDQHGFWLVKGSSTLHLIDLKEKINGKIQSTDEEVVRGDQVTLITKLVPLVYNGTPGVTSWPDVVLMRKRVSDAEKQARSIEAMGIDAALFEDMEDVEKDESPAAVAKEQEEINPDEIDFEALD